ncbi:peptidoglycan-binding protein [Ponticaulis profundi]|uniref:Peptidoglycan-binding protein n=1 Tax=Ponticaulis profundi TaxID=2665222 RepID=A0ABW1SCA0_9PROT
MATRGPWSVKGIDTKAREAALHAARSEGITLGDYLNRLLLESERQEREMSGSAEQKPSNDLTAPDFNLDALDKLTRRIEAVEARSTLAITGIDQSVVGLLARLENSESSQAAMEGRIELASDDLRQTQELLEKRIARMESDETSVQNLRALKSLESALERLAHRVEDAHQSSDEAKSMVQTRLDDVDSRMDGLTKHVESTLDEAATRVTKAVEQAELRTEGTTRHLSERLSNVESKVTETLSKASESIDRYGERIEKTENLVSEALDRADSQSSGLADISERLDRAESTTNAAIEDLENTVHKLDEQMAHIKDEVGEGTISAIRAEMDKRLQDITSELNNTIAGIRSELAEQIDHAASIPTEAFAEINSAVSEMHKRMKRAEQRQNTSVEAIGEEVARLTETLDRRVQQVEQRNSSELSSDIRNQLENLATSLHRRMTELENSNSSEELSTVTRQMNDLADALSARVNASEERSAAAIKDFSDHVSTLTRKLSAKQDESLEKLSEEIRSSENRQSERMNDAIGGVRERIEQVEEATASSVSPIQKAMASLAERLEAMEDFSSPPGVSRPKNDEFAAAAAFSDSLKEADEALSKPKPQEPESFDAPDEDDFGFEPDVPKAAAKPAVDPSDPWANDDDAFVAPEATDLDEFGDDFGVPLEAHDPDYDLDAAEDEPDDFSDSFEAQQGAGPNDYLARARAAANASQDTSRSKKHSPRAALKTSGGSSKLPLIAAASVVALAAAGTAGYMMMRGKQAPTADMLSTDRPNGDVGINTVIVPDAGQLTSDIPMEMDGDVEGLALENSTDEEAAIAQEMSAETPSSEPLKETPATLETTESAPQEEATLVPPPSSKPEPQPQQLAALSAPTPTPVSRPIDMAPAPAPAPAEPPAATPAEAEAPAEITQYRNGIAALESGDIARGASLVMQAADADLAIAQYRLAKLFERGQGVPKDLAQSRIWTQRAANGGNVKAMHDLAVFYAEGEGGQQSYAGAAQWFRKAADHGLVDSQYNLGVLYEQGLGVDANPSEALYWYRVAHKMGDTGALAKVNELSQQVGPETARQTADLASAYAPAQADAMANGRFPQAAPANMTASVTPEATPASLSSDGAMIREAQDLLNLLGYNAGGADGEFGSQTRQAIITFQAANSLPQSGAVTPTLLRQLRNASVGL